MAKPSIKLVLLGAPGAGKGTQSKHLVSEFGLAHISSGNLLRAEIQAKTPLGLEIKGIVDSGQLVPDAIMIRLIENHIAAHPEFAGWLLDGFPRTASQAEALRASAPLQPTHIVELHVSEDAILRRMAGRRFDPVTGNTYHVEHDPAPPAIAARCVVRTDDTPEVIRDRFRIYAENKGLIEAVFANSIHTIPCEGLSIDAVSAQVDAVVRDPAGTIGRC